MASPRHIIVQLPFPSMVDPHPALDGYYRDYGRRFREVIPEFDLPEHSLWELPLWVAHLSGMIESLGFEPELMDLSGEPTDERSIETVLDGTEAEDVLYLSPLAQNFDFALTLSRSLVAAGRQTLLGGNMAPLASPGDATAVHHGRLTPDLLRRLLDHGTAEPPSDRRGRIPWAPSYRLLAGHRGRFPMLRINASHGCLFRCAFCGDAWSRQLHVTEPEALEREVDELATRFPEVRLVYVGDKTFGQSKEAVRNLLRVFENRPGYRFITQTHELLVDDELIESMLRLGVVAVELGFETGDSSLVRASKKATLGTASFLERIGRLRDAGLKVVLNVMGGLPHETRESHRLTLEFLDRAADALWLFNLYSFVPYPLTPYFPVLRDRIFDWCFANWREDAPPVFHPYELSAEESWELFLEKIATAHAIVSGLAIGSAPVRRAG